MCLILPIFFKGYSKCPVLAFDHHMPYGFNETIQLAVEKISADGGPDRPCCYDDLSLHNP